MSAENSKSTYQNLVQFLYFNKEMTKILGIDDMNHVNGSIALELLPKNNLLQNISLVGILGRNLLTLTLVLK